MPGDTESQSVRDVLRRVLVKLEHATGSDSWHLVDDAIERLEVVVKDLEATDQESKARDQEEMRRMCATHQWHKQLGNMERMQAPPAKATDKKSKAPAFFRYVRDTFAMLEARAMGHEMLEEYIAGTLDATWDELTDHEIAVIRKLQWNTDPTSKDQEEER